MENYLKLTTTDNTIVYISKTSIDGIEEVAASSRSEAYLKLYVEGYKFMVKIKLEELFSQLG